MSGFNTQVIREKKKSQIYLDLSFWCDFFGCLAFFIKNPVLRVYLLCSLSPAYSFGLLTYHAAYLFIHAAYLFIHAACFFRR